MDVQGAARAADPGHGRRPPQPGAPPRPAPPGSAQRLPAESVPAPLRLLFSRASRAAPAASRAWTSPRTAGSSGSWATCSSASTSPSSIGATTASAWLPWPEPRLRRLPGAPGWVCGRSEGRAFSSGVSLALGSPRQCRIKPNLPETFLWSCFSSLALLLASLGPGSGHRAGVGGGHAHWTAMAPPRKQVLTGAAGSLA